MIDELQVVNNLFSEDFGDYGSKSLLLFIVVLLPLKQGITSSVLMSKTCFGFQKDSEARTDFVEQHSEWSLN